MAKNKIIYGGNVLIDLTDTTAVASDVASGKYFYGRDGVKTEGTSTKDSDTSDATALAAEILATKTAYVNGNKITGTMPNRGAVSGTISDAATPYTVPQGYHDGSGTVGIDSASATALVANNIREGVEILGVTGTMSGSEGMHPQSKTVTPTASSQTVLPDTGYNCLSQVTVNAIPYAESANTYGTTVTIG